MEKLIPAYARHIIRVLNARGFQAYLVGGCVRDMTMGRRPHDWDIATSALWEETEAAFKRTAPTGIKYGTVTVFYGRGEAQVTTFRTDGPYTGGRWPDSVDFVSDLGEDLRRRDFTMNAMAMDENGNITDLYGGLQDIASGIIRCVGEPDIRFEEDALRMLRAFRFSAQLGFSIEQETMAAIERRAPLAVSLSGERVREETEKMLLSPRPEILGKALELGIYARHFGPARFTDLERIKRLPKEKTLRWTALCAAIGADTLPESLRPDGRTAEAVKKAMTLYKEGLPAADWEIRCLAAVEGTEVVKCAAAALEVHKTGAYRGIVRAINGGEIIDSAKLSVKGSDLIGLGIRPGPEIGAMIRELLRVVSREPEKNEKQALLAIVKEWTER